MKRVRFLTVVLVLLSVIGLTGFAQAAIVTFEPFDPTVNPGDSFTLSIVASGFAETTLGGGLTITWNPAIITLASANDVTWTFPDAFFTYEDSPAAGMLELTVSGFSFGASGNFGIADIPFTASGVGTSFFNIGERVGFPWSDASFQDLDTQPTYVSGSVNVVPIPSTLLLLGGGLAGIFGLKRRKRS